MSMLAAQIAALRRQAGVVESTTSRNAHGQVVAAARPGPATLARPNTLPEELRRLLGIRSRSVQPAISPDRELPGIEIAPGLRYLERHFAWPEAPESVDASLAALGDIPRRQWLQFDTETTGLSGGTGTRAFMIGAADWPQQQLRVRQLFLTTMSAETAMLQTFAQWLQPDTVLVSYNGRCYDAPLLATRFRLARLANPLIALRHLDLLFPVRRRYRGVWENCRLATIERHLLGVVRDDDLPGSEAPQAWRDFLHGGSSRNFRRVIEHNDQDLRSLSALLLRMTQSEPGVAGTP
jgi:uncharacterized protein YprB with RNaseH-like and TPR domain